MMDTRYIRDMRELKGSCHDKIQIKNSDEL